MRYTLLVTRHAEPAIDWAISDKDRPLTPDGQLQSVELGKRIVQLGCQPQQIFSSDARRALQTLEGIKSTYDGQEQTSLRPEYYGGALQEIHGSLKHCDQNTTIVQVIGHNPGWSMVASELSGDAIHFDVSDTAVLEVEADSWDEALQMVGCWEVMQLVHGRKD